jgi:hypothetical protein
VDREEYLDAIAQAIHGLETARVTLVKMRNRLAKHPGKQE